MGSFPTVLGDLSGAVKHAGSSGSDLEMRDDLVVVVRARRRGAKTNG